MKNKNYYTNEEIKMARKYEEETQRQKEIQRAKEIVIEKKGDFLRIGNAVLNLKNIDIIKCDFFCCTSGYVFDFNYSEAGDIFISRIMESL